MTPRRPWRLLLVLAILTSAASAAHYHVARPRIWPGLPVHDYQHGSRSASKVAVSRTALLVRTVPPGLPGERPMKLFQLDRPKELEIEHCAITQVALQLDREGYWTLSLRAYQNAALPADQAAKADRAENAERRTAKERAGVAEGGALFDKRNLFVVKLRAYAMFSEEAESRDKLPGKPVMFTLGPESFWVERGEPLDFHRQYRSGEIAKYFDYVERVDLEFYYR